MNTDQFKDNIFKKLQDGFGIALVVLVIYYAITLEIDRSKYTIVFLGLSYALILLKNIGGSRFQYRQRRPSMVIGSFGLISVFLAASAYLYWQYVPLFSERAGAYNSTDVLAAAAIFIPLFFIIWSEGGSALFVLICLFTFYFLYGNLFPGIFEHSGFSIRRTLEETILGFDGVYGVVLLTISTWVSIFLIYAGIIQGFGTLETIVKGCTLIFSRKKILIPQIPVVVSLIFGTFSGAATANVAGTGSFTIKIMKRFGLTSRLAAAIESVASSGGQIMPPLMGATAFLIASFLGVSYLYVVAIGFIPALLFYTALAFSVYLRTARVIDANTVVVEDAIFTKQDWLELLPLLLSLLVLFIRLILLVPMMAACIESIEVLIFAQFLHEVFRDRHTKTFWAIAHAFIRSLFTGICRTAPSVASIGIVGACMGLIVRVLTATGLGPKLSAGIVDISGGSLPLLLLLTMLLTLLFGMAVSTIAVYILTTFVCGAGFRRFGHSHDRHAFHDFLPGQYVLYHTPGSACRTGGRRHRW